MDRRIVRASSCLCLGLLVLLASVAGASQNGVSLSGSYHVVQKQITGSRVKVTLHVQLTNLGSDALTIRQLSLKDGLTQIQKQVLMNLGPRAMQGSTQSFNISRREYENWRRGVGPVVQITTQTENGSSVSQAIRLDGFGGGVK